MAIKTNDKVKFIYVKGSALPSTVDESTIYVIGGTAEMYVGSMKIAANIDVDSVLDLTSTNPVQNSVITGELHKKANLASPTFTGTPKAPTASAGTSTTQIATTEFVQNAVDATTPTYTAVTGKPTGNQTPAFGGTATISQVSQSTTGQVSVTDRTIKIPNTAATTSAAGLMSKDDKSKLDGIESGANKTVVDTAMSTTSTNPVQNKVVKQAINDAIAASDAMIFKGTLGTGGTITALPTTYKTGWTYRVITAGTYAGNVCEIGDLIIALTDRSGSGNVNSDWTVAQTNINGAITSISGTSPIEVSGSGSSRTIAHKAYTARTGKPTANQTPAFGGTATVSQITSDATGHVTGATDRTIKIPDTVATTSASGLMSSDDKSKLDGIAEGANAYTHPSYTARTGVPTANQAPGFGGTFTVNQVNCDATGHVTASTSRTITIPSTEATTSAKGLLSASDKTKLNNLGAAANLSVPIPIASGGTGSTTNIAALNALRAKSLGEGIEIVASTDLNSISTIGNYYCKLNTTAATLTNCPTTKAFVMYVGYSAGDGYLYQEIHQYNTGGVYYRFNDSSAYNASKWTAWQNREAFLPLTGGQITNGTATPVITNKHGGVDCLLADNGVTAIQYPTTGRFHDKSDACFAGSEARVRPTGEIQMDLICRNYIVGSSKWSGYTKFGVGVNKEGKPFYEVTSPVELRNQLGIAYGTCDTAAGTAAKVVSCPYLSYKLSVGSYVAVKFTNTNTAASPTLNVNGSGAKPIVYGTGTITNSNLKYAGTANIVMYYVYDGTSWVWIGQSQDENATGYLPLTGGTVTGQVGVTDRLTIHHETTTDDDSPAFLRFAIKDTDTGQTYSGDIIRVYQDHGVTTYGANLVVSPGGMTIIGAGESAQDLYPQLKLNEAIYNTETMWLISDSTVTIQAGGQTIANRKGVQITTAGALVPAVKDVATNNVQSIGTADYKWKDVYATTIHGNLDGNATTATSATKLGTARTIDGVDFDGSAAIIHYGTCATAAGTAAKVVACTSFKLVTGSTIRVKFTVTNTANNPTLNVNSTGAKNIFYKGAAITAGYLIKDHVYEFVYDGTQYCLVGEIYSAATTSIGSASAGTAIAADDITAWSAGTLPTLGTAIPADDITAWSAGTLPTLGTAIPADDITAWSAGTLPTLGTAIPADDITSWNAGTAASASVSGGVLTITNGTAPSLAYTAKSIPNVTAVGTLPSLSYTAKSIPNVTGVGTLPSLSYTARSIPNISVTSKTVVTGI